jgi:lipoic acid synthetase
LDVEEPHRLAAMVQAMSLRYVVVTSVTRDDLPDGGAEHFAHTIDAIQEQSPDTVIEVLVPDFAGNEEALQKVLAAQPEVLNHNIETVERVFSAVRPQGSYRRSLELLAQAHRWGRCHPPSMAVKSGLMLGMGETNAEIQQTLEDLLHAGCRLLTLGQYLPPSPQHYPLHRYLLPWEFDTWREKALKMGFVAAASGPLVRSSHQAERLFDLAIFGFSKE